MLVSSRHSLVGSSRCGTGNPKTAPNPTAPPSLLFCCPWCAGNQGGVTGTPGVVLDALERWRARDRDRDRENNRPSANTVAFSSSGIFGYINYLVEKDRKFIVDTLINGTSSARRRAPRAPATWRRRDGALPRHFSSVQTSNAPVADVDSSRVIRPLPSRVPRLRLCRLCHRWRQEERGVCLQGGRQGRQAEAAGRRVGPGFDQSVRFTLRHRPHPLGYPRPSVPPQLPPPQVCRSSGTEWN